MSYAPEVAMLSVVLWVAAVLIAGMFIRREFRSDNPCKGMLFDWYAPWENPVLSAFKCENFRRLGRLEASEVCMASGTSEGGR
jgi:hypothetical protein